ncbi:MAG: ABC transporter substrate-binding protein [Eubacteriales bacterium]|nr:ABC transporter substrate-binding protein [Eubacteriales bacterium]
MDMFDSLDALDAIRFSGQRQEGWYIDSARQAMEEGKILYAGKYSEPDYELIVSEGCSLAIENRMITHSPEVKEMLEDFGIPVMIEYSSYETHPLGRVEWVKFFGALVGKEQEAEEVFARQEASVEQAAGSGETDLTVAFFFITSNGLAQVRAAGDYIPKMIELAGGRYVFEDLDDPGTNRSTVNLQIEEFYDRAKDADCLVYNSSIDGGVSSVGQLLEKCPVLEDFKAVREGNVWCTSRDMYQQSMSVGALTLDFAAMLHGGSEEEMTYLFRLSSEEG